MGVREAHLHLSYRPFVIRGIPSQTNEYRFVMGLQQWYEVYELGENQLHGAPAVTLIK